jgi:hypothetical protein
MVLRHENTTKKRNIAVLLEFMHKFNNFVHIFVNLL